MTKRTIIIGGGQAGAQAAVSLRQAGYDGDVVLICAEAHPPYQRPPLSKAYLKGAMDRERLFLRPTAFYETQDIRLHLNDQATEIEPEKKTVRTQSGVEIGYSQLLIATGAPPRRLSCPGADLNGIHYLRNLHDSDALRELLVAEGQVAIVGAGYIGLEVAAILREAGRDVIIIEMADRVLARVASAPVSEFYKDLHSRAGASFLLGAAVESFVGDDSVRAVKLAGGEEIDCAAALVGIGAIPETRLAERAGLEVNNGIIVDDHARTSNPHIWAAGDCTSFPLLRYGRCVRLESVPNAIEQAKVAAVNIAGGNAVHDALPWFWSDQYDVKLQTAGLSEGYDDVVIRGAIADKKFSVWYLKNDVLLAVDAINEPAVFMLSKKLLLNNAMPSRQQIEDVTFDLKMILHM